MSPKKPIGFDVEHLKNTTERLTAATAEPSKEKGPTIKDLESHIITVAGDTLALHATLAQLLIAHGKPHQAYVMAGLQQYFKSLQDMKMSDGLPKRVQRQCLKSVEGIVKQLSLLVD